MQIMLQPKIMSGICIVLCACTLILYSTWNKKQFLLVVAAGAVKLQKHKHIHSAFWCRDSASGRRVASYTIKCLFACAFYLFLLCFAVVAVLLRWLPNRNALYLTSVTALAPFNVREYWAYRLSSMPYIYIYIYIAYCVDIVCLILYW